MANNFMPGEMSGIPQQPDRINGLLSNPFLQIGLGILANNQGNYGRLAPAIGKGALYGMQQLQAQKQFELQQQQMEALQKFRDAQVKQLEAEQEREKRKQEALPRLISGDYTQTTQIPVTSFENVPMKSTIDAPNFNLQRNEVTTMQPQPTFNNSQYMKDLVDAGYGDTLLKNQIESKFQKPEIVFAPNGMAVDKNDRSIIGKSYAKLEDSEQNPNKPFLMVNGQIVPNKAYQDYELRKTQAGAARTNVSVGGAQILPEKFTDKVNVMAAENLMGQYGEARNASAAVSAVKDAISLLDKGMFTGKAAGLQESMAGWYQAATGETLPKLDATQQFKTVIGDIVLPALSNLKGASSDRDFIKIEEYSRGQSDMTESALRGHLKRLQNKYGNQIKNYNKGYTEYIQKNGTKLPGMDEIQDPSGNFTETKNSKKSSIGKGGWSAREVK